MLKSALIRRRSAGLVTSSMYVCSRTTVGLLCSSYSPSLLCITRNCSASSTEEPPTTASSTSTANTTTTSPVMNAQRASEEARKAFEGVLLERRQLSKEQLEAHDENLRRRGVDVNQLHDLEFDKQAEEAEVQKAKLSQEQVQQQRLEMVTASSGGLGFSMKIKLKQPEKPDASQPRIPVKPGQSFQAAVEEATQGVVDEYKKKATTAPSSAKSAHPAVGVPAAPPLPSAASAKPSSSSIGRTSASAAVPPPPPLPFAQQQKHQQHSSPSPPPPGQNNNNNSLPTDDDICYFIRGVIERGASKISCDITTLQLSLTKPFMDALAARHNSSLVYFAHRHNSRFKYENNRLFLIGLEGQQEQQPGTAVAPTISFGMRPAAANNNQPSDPTAPPSSQMQPQGVKPFNPLGSHRRPPSSLPQHKSAGASQSEIAASSSSSSAPPPPSSFQQHPTTSRGTVSSSAAFAAPALPQIPKNPVTASEKTQQMMETAFMTKSWKSPAEIVDNLMDYIPSFWVPMRFVHAQLPFEIKELYQQKMRLNNFLRKFQYYFDTKLTPKGAEVRVRDDCQHPKKGAADELYASFRRSQEARQQQQQQQQQAALRKASSSTGSLSSAPVSTSPSMRRYVDVDEHSLAGQLKQLCTNAFKPLKEFQSSLPTAITAHPDYAAAGAAGVLGILEKYPFIFQVANDCVRLRQSGVAPNALDGKGRSSTDSPLPEVFAKVMTVVPDAYDVEIDVASVVKAAHITPDELKEIKKVARSFPRFLRLHGAALEVSKDNATVRRFQEPSVRGRNDHHGSSMMMSDDDDTFEDPLEPSEISAGGHSLPKPGKDMADASPVQWALKELYNNLPLSTCVALDEAVSMLPAQMRDAAATCPDLVSEMKKYPDYFHVWRSPDDEDEDGASNSSATKQKPDEKKPTYIVQRAILGEPDVELSELATTAANLISQGGIDADKLMRRLPPRMQRYLYRFGLKATMQKLPDKFLVVGNKVLSIAVKDDDDD